MIILLKVMQCGREYGFADGIDENPRATQLFKLSSDDLKDMPTNNINVERDLAKFSYLALCEKIVKTELSYLRKMYPAE